MRHYAFNVHSEAEYESAWKKLIDHGFWAQGWGTNYARYRLGNVEVMIITCF